MELTHAIILGLIQGLTEFLPVSSSGHLVILQVFMGMKDAAENITFDLFLHIATLIAVCIAYRKDLIQIFTSRTVGVEGAEIPKWRLIGFLAISVVATGIILPFKDAFETLFENVNGVRIFLLLNAIFLGVLPLLRRGTKSMGEMTWVFALVIGLAQAVGAFPGISRSGSTIIAGLLLGLSPRDACKYSFLLSIPTILLAALVQVPDAIEAGFNVGAVPLIIGGGIATVSALVAIPLLVGIVERGKLWGFAVYCAIVGIALFLVQALPA